ncbi:MAG TPA: hypothetical protein VFG69_03240, partial [Nannocystaceae bacterium]|nr:hypothetical protein [Nannocystaceae bacterium]
MWRGRCLAIANVGLVALVAEVACCPIPVPDEILVFPAASLVVLDASDAPVAGARILVQAELQPHATPNDPSIELTTGEDGRAVLVERIDDTTSYPLMMHGVAAYSWTWCAEHPAHGATTEVDRLSYENPTELVAHLRGTKGVCGLWSSRAT